VLAPAASGHHVVGLHLARGFRCGQQLFLETAVGDGQEALDHLGIRLTAQIGDTVFGHHHVAQVARNGHVAVIRHDIRDNMIAGSARGTHAEHGAGSREVVGHGNEVVLSAHAADDRPILERIRGHGAAQGDHHPRVDKARIASLRLVKGRVLEQLVGAQHAGHAQLLLQVVV
jgi:hypothetical protein